LLGFFDFPGLDHPSYLETIGALQHLAISVSPESFDRLKKRLDEAGIAYLGPDRGANDSLYIRDPNGMGIELYREVLGHFEGSVLLPD
jgi:glyoxylase I family protein